MEPDRSTDEVEFAVGDLAPGQVFLIPGRKGVASGPWSVGAKLPSGKVAAHHVRRLSYEVRLLPATAVSSAPAGSPVRALPDGPGAR